MAQNTGARSAGGDTPAGSDARGGLDARDDGRHTGRTPAQWYCLLAGLALLLAGILGFVADASFEAGNGVDGGSLLGFEVNGWHNLVHLASGALLLSAFAKRKPAKTVAIAFGVVYGLVTLIGIVDGEDILGLLPVNAADNVLHLALALTGILAGLVSPTDEGHRVAPGTDRRATGTAADGRTSTRNDRDDRFGRDADPLTGNQRDNDRITRN
jgi:Domain of unknown function (DUF4383)